MAKKEISTEKPTNAALVAVVRVRGNVNLSHRLRKALDMLCLRKNHVCVVRPDSPSLRGMLTKVKDQVTWGTINDETKALLEQKRKTRYENVYFLAPPRKGFGREGIKKSFTVGGSLGNRRDAINELIQRMI